MGDLDAGPPDPQPVGYCTDYAGVCANAHLREALTTIAQLYQPPHDYECAEDCPECWTYNLARKALDQPSPLGRGNE